MIRRSVLRNRQIKNFFALELLSAGTPMLLMGDEVRRTQRGNNNGYCQDSEVSWFDWTLLQRHADIHRFVKALNRFRQRRDVVAEMSAPTLNELLRRAPIEWHGVALNRPDWSDHSHSLAFTLRSFQPVSAARDAQCLLGTTDIRVASDARRASAGLVSLDRYRARLTQ
jgi:isoamylase